MFFFPLTSIGHSTALYFALQKWTDFSKIKSVKLAVGLSLLMPIYALILVKSYDSFGSSFKKLKYLFTRIFKRDIYEQFNDKK